MSKITLDPELEIHLCTFDIICLQEIWYLGEEPLKGYLQFYKPAIKIGTKARPKGGLSIYVTLNKTLSVTELEIDSSFMQALQIHTWKTESREKMVVVVNVYLNPKDA